MHYAMKTCGKLEVYRHLLSSMLDEGEWFARFSASTHLIRGWVGHRDGLDDME
jgi:hypothetical protein